MRYDHTGEGLIFDQANAPAVTTPDAAMEETPFSGNPLDTLKKGIQEAD